MNKISNNMKVVCGTIMGTIIGGMTVVGANQAIQAMQNTEIKVSLNGQVQMLKDETTGEVQYPITYHDRTYLPLRNVAQLAGLSVDYDSNSNTALLSGIDIMRGDMLLTETQDILYENNKLYFYINGSNKKYEIKGLEGKEVQRALLYHGPQIVYSSKLVLQCDDGLYFADWKDFDVYDAVDGKVDPSLTDVVYARKINTKSDNIMSIMKTSYYTGDIMEGYKNYVVVIYPDGSYEEIYVLNNRMAS